jgi:hypothetical protein
VLTAGPHLGLQRVLQLPRYNCLIVCKRLVHSTMASSMSIQGAYETATCVVRPQVGRNNAAGSKDSAGGQGQSLKELK